MFASQSKLSRGLFYAIREYCATERTAMSDKTDKYRKSNRRRARRTMVRQRFEFARRYTRLVGLRRPVRDEVEIYRNLRGRTKLSTGTAYFIGFLFFSFLFIFFLFLYFFLSFIYILLSPVRRPCIRYGSIRCNDLRRLRKRFRDRSMAGVSGPRVTTLDRLIASQLRTRRANVEH